VVATEAVNAPVKRGRATAQQAAEKQQQWQAKIQEQIIVSFGQQTVCSKREEM
jgi:hypothetical protein